MPRFRRSCTLVSAIAATAFLIACSEPAPPTVDETPIVSEPVVDQIAPEGQLGGMVEPTLYQVELKIDPREDSFSGLVTIEIQLKEATDHIWLHGKGLNVSEVYLVTAANEQVGAAYEQKLDHGVSLVSLAKTVDAGPATLHFRYSAAFNTASNALFKAVRGEDSYAVTQFEPIAARQAFPGFDEPSFKVPFDLAVISREGDVTITTTPEISIEALEDGYVRRVFDRTRPLPTYLLAFAVGPFDLVDYGMIPTNSVRDHEVPLRGLAASGQGDRLSYALERTAGLLEVLEEYFGTPYPYQKLDLIAVPEGFGGAMENPGAITYNEYLLLMDEDSDLDQRRAYTAVHAHEMAHQWFGNLVTPTWWNDIWLNEAFASWIMFKISDRFWQEGEFDRETLKGALGAMTNDSLAAARQIREPVTQNEKITDAFDGITYQKGGGVLAMLERYVGEEEFRTGIQLHMERHADGTATAEDFIESLAEGSGRPEIEAAFRSYIEQPGVPLVSTQVNCDDEGNPLLEVSQSRYAPLGSSIDPTASEWRVPLCVNYVTDGGPESTCVMLNESKQTIPLESDSCPTQLHPNADGAGYYRFAMDETWWNGLIAVTPGLVPSEALVMVDSLDAGFRAGTVTAETYVTGMNALLNHETWDVADSAMNALEQVTQIFDSSQLPAVEQAFRKMARSRFALLEGESNTGSDLLRQRMQRFLIVIAKDQDMRKPLAKSAADRIGLDGEPDLSALPGSELETAFSVAVQDIGEPFFDLLLKQAIASEDPSFRSAATGALARVEDPVLVGKLHSALMGDNFKGTEFTSMINRQIFRAATTEATYSWVREHNVGVFEKIPEFFRSSIVPGLGSAFCSNERADEWQTFIKSYAAELPGYERSLDQAVESIRLCAALREARAADLLKAFTSMN